jgi:hypothetical protein
VSEFWKIYDTYITREGSAELKEWIKATDFMVAPASTKYHESYRGGLAEHSVNVFRELVRLLKAYPEVKCSTETAAIVALLHDLCKADTYVTELRNKKENGVWVQVPFYVFNERFKFGGHGSKSVYLIQKYMKLTDEESVAINCHMGAAGNDFSVYDAYRQFPLAFLLHAADMASTIDLKK